jgi:hypothetical protein
MPESAVQGLEEPFVRAHTPTRYGEPRYGPPRYGTKRYGSGRPGSKRK